MNTFGIRMGEPGDFPPHYIADDSVTDDSVLFDWLVAENYERTDKAGVLNVRVPEGYIFRDETLVLVSECSEEEVRSAEDEDSDMWLDLTVRYAYRDSDKASFLIEYLMKRVSPAEFYTLGIPDDRALDFIID